MINLGWDVDRVIADFLRVAELAGVDLDRADLEVERCPAPHRQPSRLPPGKMAVYVFSAAAEVLKVGQAGPNSAAR